MSTTCDSVIRPQDFQKSTADPNYGTWEVGAMRHVIAALDGQEVALTTDRLSGHTLIGVTLLRVTGTRGGTGYSVLAQSTFEDGTESVIAYPLRSLGEAIMPLGKPAGEKSAKWTAIETHRTEGSAATRRAQAEHAEGRWGRWEARLGYDSVSVSFHPQTNAPEGDNVGELGKFAYWTYRTADLLAEVGA